MKVLINFVLLLISFELASQVPKEILCLTVTQKRDKINIGKYTGHDFKSPYVKKLQEEKDVFYSFDEKEVICGLKDANDCYRAEVKRNKLLIKNFYIVLDTNKIKEFSSLDIYKKYEVKEYEKRIDISTIPAEDVNKLIAQLNDLGYGSHRLDGKFDKELKNSFCSFLIENKLKPVFTKFNFEVLGLRY